MHEVVQNFQDDSINAFSFLRKVPSWRFLRQQKTNYALVYKSHEMANLSIDQSLLSGSIISSIPSLVIIIICNPSPTSM